MLELHVWGPVFGVPSIDAECIAAITYLHNAVRDDIEFRIVPSNNVSVSPSGLLPALNHDGVWTSGYPAIVRYLYSKSLADDLDGSLDAAHRADVVAFSAYLGVHASALLDLSLYVSAANWSAATRPAYSALLRFPLTWTVPTLIRADAIQRVEHLGLAELDTDFDPHGGLHLTAGRDALPEAFRKHLPGTSKHKNTVKEEMTPEQSVAIRLFSLTESCLGTLEDLLSKADRSPRFFPKHGTKRGLTSLDCLAFGYLALMLKAPVPRAFLKDWVAEHAPCLTLFVDDVLANATPATDSIVWAAPPRRGYLSATGRVLDSVVRHMPVFGEHYAGEVRRRCEGKMVGIDRRSASLTAALLFAGAGFGYATYWYRSLEPFGARSQTWRSHRPGNSRLSQFGELGSMLDSVLGPVKPVASPIAGAAGIDGRIVDLDSEID
ncbi:mitochondrial import receptor subunit [Cordyceps fumosorosea ARSEF 2679]|uniref:Mitochondrial import receptor subunit n=1 Tax=Cordyceps fumosorosea (strain ARSEF 2679) TaxID=1081104 RepID=A0A168AJC4_CORFA|nr:mitochondrial import receptor subunit [Cordyceps fumosorosea ARSEF 2679]OAA68827.1 mitochondrial import receptor subunit [Cordyceps fumosorosea ARSEF 2679]